MDSIRSLRSSPVSPRQPNHSPAYDTSPESCSFCDDDRQELTEWDQHSDQPDNNNCGDNYDKMNKVNNCRNNNVATVPMMNGSKESAVTALSANLIDQKISALLRQSKCRAVANNFDKQIVNDFKQYHSPDVESQKTSSDLKRNKSFIKRLYSGNGPRRRIPVSGRLSILGKPIPHHRLKNDISFYRERVAVYNFLQRPTGCVAIGYHLFVSLAVSVCLLLAIVSTIPDYENYSTSCLSYMDGLIVALFSSEFIARFWSSSCVCHYQGWTGKLRFLRNPFRLIDMFVIITSCIVLFFDTQSHKLFIYFRGFRFLQVFQMLRLEHRFRPWRLMASVVWAQREHLAITTYMGFLALLFISFVIYYVEKDKNPAFNSIASSMWWGVITLCTVGYGDMSPVTPFGKFLSCLCILIGVSIFALPAGILGTGLALKVQEQQRVRQLGKRREPAAKLIQWTWRCYAASEDSTSVVTWSRHIHPNRSECLSPQEKTAIRFVRIVKYFIARRRFNTANKPYDIKDVLEQYASGHADVVGRVKHMQFKIGSLQSSVAANLKNMNESKVSLTMRMAHMESMTEDLQNKVSQLMVIQAMDKTIIQTLVSALSPQNKCDINNGHSLSVSNRTRRQSF